MQCRWSEFAFQTQPLLRMFPLGNPSAGGAIPQHKNSEYQWWGSTITLNYNSGRNEIEEQYLEIPRWLVSEE